MARPASNHSTALHPHSMQWRALLICALLLSTCGMRGFQMPIVGGANSVASNPQTWRFECDISGPRPSKRRGKARKARKEDDEGGYINRWRSRGMLLAGGKGKGTAALSTLFSHQATLTLIHIHTHTQPPTHSLCYSPTHSLIHSFTCSIVLLLTHSIAHSFTQLLTHSFTYPLNAHS
ncbi:hypothetical protein GQ42DRAFT_21010 [Ramicandelaber brevisporus]|nr:hypothetical protein GQ42DRAFT_21010 [Ramicandelaber brevisporus]